MAISSQYSDIGGLPSEVITVSLGVTNMLTSAEVESIGLIYLGNQALRKERNRVVLSSNRTDNLGHISNLMFSK
ncbi:hypothetical protein [Rivularia sp. PCC 7116]|uniref:hypothetical protein n=1 Tax=Rivularia sp. PCC 7116 TaxID=373994 RepID=UPI0005C7D986|nr:hypothetical protein [Rivularia sp. PCC 7116]